METSGIKDFVEDVKRDAEEDITFPKPEHSEGRIARAIEKQTAKMPSDTFLWLAIGSMVGSATLQILGKKQVSNFIGQWAPSLLVIGLYNKLVKVSGSH